MNANLSTEILQNKLILPLIYNEHEVVEQMIKDGANVNETKDTPSGVTTMLMYAVQSGSCESAELILKAGADPNVKYLNKNVMRDCNALDRLVIAKFSDSTEKLLLLLKQYGADINQKVKKDNDFGGVYTPLTYSINYAENQTAFALINLGSDMNIGSNDSSDALYMARVNNNPEIIAYIEHVLLQKVTVNSNVLEDQMTSTGKPTIRARL